MPSRRAVSSFLGWALLAAALVAQYALFRGYVEREIAWGYPRMWDQGPLLAHSYAVYETWQADGFTAAFEQAWRRRAPQGGLLYFETALSMQVLGASRLAALTLVFLHWALLQVVLAWTLRKLVPGWTVPALALGLLWSLDSPAYWGGLFDFRLDFMALCLQGVWLGLALRADALARSRGVLAAGAAAAGLAVLRYITFVYAWVTLVAFAALELAATRGSPAGRARARGAATVLVLVTLAAAPFFWWSRAQLGGYYWAGHVVGGDTLRRAMGLLSAADVWLYYPRTLAEHHLSGVFLVLAPAVGLLAAAVCVFMASRRGGRARETGVDLGAAARLLACATLGPLAVLSANPAKSPVVAGVLLPGVVLLLVLPAVALLRRGLARRAWAALAAVACVAGLGHHVAFLRGPGPLNAEPADSRAVTALHETLARVSLERGWTRPDVLIDSSEEHVVRWNTAVVSYERLGKLVEPRLPLGGIEWNAVERARFEEVLPHIQIVVVTRDYGPAGPRDRPFDRSMAALQGTLLAAIARDFDYVAGFAVRGRQLELHVRRRVDAPPPA